MRDVVTAITQGGFWPMEKLCRKVSRIYGRVNYVAIHFEMNCHTHDTIEIEPCYRVG